MFHFPGFPTLTYGFRQRSTTLRRGSFLIRISADRRLFAAPRSFSQLVTSFIGSQCQGILHMLFFAWTTKVLQYFLYILWYTSVLIAWIAVFHTCSFIWQNCFFYPKQKNLIYFLVFPFTYVCHVCHTNSFELIWSFLLFGFQWTFRLTLSN